MSTPDFDPARFKALERAGFNRIAARYADGAHLRSDLADALLEAADLAPGQHVLDLASGPCLLARDAAQRIAPDGWVLATDIAEVMLAEGRRRATALSGCSALAFAAADAEQLCVADASVDRVLAGLALFMFPHAERALAEMRRVLRPGGRLAMSVWGPREAVPLIGCAQDCIARLLPAPRVPRPSVFRFGDTEQLTDALQRAGFADVRVAPCRFACHFDSAADYWQAFLDLAGGAAESLARLPDTTQQRLRAAVAEELARYRDKKGGGFALEALALVVSARA
ncbi:MAG TPA: class I SAM-dependent methyltransferase [Rhodocyclaceae bacterium]|nr:class I SAM-dependent methyltransferase [Rhodocyclaceae bacterium]